MSNPIKYPCEDGIDRDQDIENYLITEEKLRMARLRLAGLKEKIETYEEELQEIEIEELGSIGSSALEKARASFDPKKLQPSPRYRAEKNQVIETHPIQGDQQIAEVPDSNPEADSIAKRIASALNSSETTIITLVSGARIMGGF